MARFEFSYQRWFRAAVVTITAVALTGSTHAQRRVGPQIRIDTHGGTAAANETSMASSDFNPLEVVGTWNDYREPGVIRMGVALSLDGGHTWDDFLIRPPAQFQTSVEGDPMTAYDHRTGTLWVGAVAFGANGGVFVARKQPGAATFEPAVMAYRFGGADKGWMAAGPAPGNPNSTVLYMAYNLGLQRSFDMGQTWDGPRSLGPGLGFLPRVGPNGELYVIYWDFSDGVWLQRSLNGGSSFETPIRIARRMDVWGINGTRFPGTFRVPSLNYLAVDPNNGTLYAVWFDTTNIVNGDANVDLYFNKSTDRGSTWSTPRVINNDADPPGDQFFPWLEVDHRGRLHMVLYDSRNTVQRDNQVPSMLDAYYMFSDDGGDTWDEARLTPQPFNGEDDGRGGGTAFIGDYSGLAVGGDRAYPCYLSNQNGDSDIFTHIIESALPGDMNCDGRFDGGDVDPFFLALGDPAAYMEQFPECDLLNGDMNRDGTLNGGDIDPFFICLGGGNCP